MRDAWEDPRFAADWDAGAAHGNPSRIDQMRLLAHLVERLHGDRAVLDIGGGSGLLEAEVFARFPQARFILVDGSRPMLELARRRLADALDRVELIEADFAALMQLPLAAAPFRLVVSMQALHHVPDEVKLAVVRRVHQLLEPGGFFVWGDRVSVSEPSLRPAYAATWEHWDQTAAQPSNTSAEEFFERYQDKDDFPASFERHLELLRAGGFEAACLQIYLNRAIFAGCKLPARRNGE